MRSTTLRVGADDHLPPHPAKDDLEVARLADAEDVQQSLEDE